VRDQLRAEHVCDLRYENVRRDPVAAARRIYEHFGWPLSPQAESQMNIVLAQQSSQTNGVHRYDAAYFRLDAANDFAEYCERFDFASPAPRQRTKCAEVPSGRKRAVYEQVGCQDGISIRP